MKGMSISDTIGIITAIIILFIFFFKLLPQILELVINLFSKTSAEAVSRQLASLITVSGSSPYKIKINYIPTSLIIYDVFSTDRIVTVKPNYEVSYGEKSSAKSPYAVPLDNFNFDDVNLFKIVKNFEKGESYYSIQAEKIEEAKRIK